jgi:hypothetical protein
MKCQRCEWPAVLMRFWVPGMVLHCLGCMRPARQCRCAARGHAPAREGEDVSNPDPRGRQTKAKA